jgi:hypothetical protein
MYKFLGSATCILVGMLCGALPATAAMTLASHRAVYDLVLDQEANRAGLESADGRMAFEISGSSCDGWTVNFRMVNRFKPTEENERTIDTRSSSWEAGDYASMRYTQSEFIDNAMDSETMISAEKLPGENRIKGRTTKPEAKEFDIDPKAIFPVEHQMKLMHAAERGESRDVSIVYDGSDAEKSYRTISFIGMRHEPGKGPEQFSGKGSEVLKALPSWPVSISYYDEQPKPDDLGEQTPVYQVSFEMYSNGVASRLRLNYGDFSLKGSLSSLEFLEQAPCN